MVMARPAEITLDFSTYNPVGLDLKEKGFLERDIEKDGIRVNWVQTSGLTMLLCR